MILVKRVIVMVACLSLFIFSFGTDLRAYSRQEQHYEETIIVTASKIPEKFIDLIRSVTVIDRERIERAPVNSIQDLLEYILGIDVKQRGPLGVQADVSIRGGTFEQTLILIDGIKISDPQTGHHNLDLALTLDDIEKIEILRGQASRLYGPNAFAGVINIMTRKSKKKVARFKASFGEHSLRAGTVSFSYPDGLFGHRLSLSRKSSDGYQEDTEFDILNVHYGSSLKIGSGKMDLSLGYEDKKFGAYSFYSNNFPYEWEQTQTMFLHVSTFWKGMKHSFSPKLYWRRHKDDFVLDRQRPEWYRNQHTTDAYGMEVQFRATSMAGPIAFGGEVGSEQIKSSNLGDHSRTKGGFYLEQHIKMPQRFRAALGAFAYYYTGWGWEFYPGIDFGFQAIEGMRLYASFGRSFRVPTFTELFYSSPANKGNPDLRPEKAWSYETGMSLMQNYFEGSLSLFHREGHDLIDWVRAQEDDPWEVKNITTVRTNGLEIDIGFHPKKMKRQIPISRIQVSYALLDSDKEIEDFESKYLLYYLKNQFVLDVEHDWFSRLKQNWKLRYENRTGYKKYVLLDTRIFWESKNFELFMEATNLFNTAYMDIRSIPMPDRWVRVGLSYEWGRKN